MKQQERVFCLGFMALKIDYDGHKVNSFKKTHHVFWQWISTGFLEHITGCFNFFLSWPHFRFKLKLSCGYSKTGKSSAEKRYYCPIESKIHLKHMLWHQKERKETNKGIDRKTKSKVCALFQFSVEVRKRYAKS